MDARRRGVLYSHRSEAPEICARKTRKRIRRAGGESPPVFWKTKAARERAGENAHSGKYTTVYLRPVGRPTGSHCCAFRHADRRRFAVLILQKREAAKVDRLYPNRNAGARPWRLRADALRAVQRAAAPLSSGGSSKKDGGTRTLLVPDEPTKIVQRAILSNLLSREPVSPAAAAYRPAFGPERGARLHVGAKKVLTLDVRGFFDHIRYPDVKNCAFPKERYSEALRVLLARLCCPFESLPQGAPTSPAISNLVMREFDETMLSYCAARGIAYSRYCDDMTFSGDFDAGELAKFAADLLGARGMTLNRKKTRVRTNAQRQRVTGLVVNERVRTDSGLPPRASAGTVLLPKIRHRGAYGAKKYHGRLGKLRALPFGTRDAGAVFRGGRRVTCARTGVSHKLLNIGKLNIRKHGGMKQ